jgi:hypothetical protein
MKPGKRSKVIFMDPSEVQLLNKAEALQRGRSCIMIENGDTKQSIRSVCRSETDKVSVERRRKVEQEVKELGHGTE